MLTCSQASTAVQNINQDVDLSDKRNRESLSSVSHTDLSHPPQPKRKCSHKSVDIASSGVAPSHEKPGTEYKTIMPIGSKIQQNITGMVELAAPSDQGTKDAAKHVAQKISSMIDTLSEYKTKRDITRHIHKISGSLGINTSADSFCLTADNLVEDLMEFSPWIKKTSASKEKSLPMHAFAHFAYFVADCVPLLAPKDCQPQRVIVPIQPTTSEFRNCNKGSELFGAKLEYRNPGAIWRHQIDLRGDGDLVRGLQRSWYIGSAMITASVENASKAFEKMGNYAEYLYYRLPERGFMWGLAAVGSLVHATLFGPNFTLSSVSMDVRTKTGRDQFIQLLVNWSYCDDYRLGYGHGMRYDPLLCHTEIPVDDIDEEEGTVSQKKYYGGSAAYVGASRLHGHHTRCMVVTDTFPETDFKPDYSDDNSILVKDSWQLVDDNNFSDEIKHLRDITKRLAGKEEVKGMYPELLAGGCIQVDGRDETTRGFLGEHIWKQLKNTPVYVHRRMVTRGFGENLLSVRSVPELIIVLADAMKVYSEIYKTCGIYHRDISLGNILVRRCKKTGKVKGMLIDFDNAIKVDDLPKETRGTIGTPPFFSIGRFENLGCLSNQLDDWESLLYMVCWLGIHGINGTYQVNRSGELSHSERWQVVYGKGMGGEKRDDMDLQVFRGYLLDRFNLEHPYGYLLWELANNLHSTLFYNYAVEGKGRGYKTGAHQPNQRPNNRSAYFSVEQANKYMYDDPLMCRKNDEDVKEICEDLMSIMEEFKEKAINLL